MSDDLLARIEKLEALVQRILPGATVITERDSKPPRGHDTTPKEVLTEWDECHEYIRQTVYIRSRGPAEARDAKTIIKAVPDHDRRKALMYTAMTDPYFESRNGTFTDFVTGLPKWVRELEKAEGAPEVQTRAKTARDRLKAAVRHRIMERRSEGGPRLLGGA